MVDKFKNFRHYKTFKGFWNKYFDFRNPHIAHNHPEGDAKFVWDLKEERIRELEADVEDLNDQLKFERKEHNKEVEYLKRQNKKRFADYDD